MLIALQVVMKSTMICKKDKIFVALLYLFLIFILAFCVLILTENPSSTKEESLENIITMDKGCGQASLELLHLEFVPKPPAAPLLSSFYHSLSDYEKYLIEVTVEHEVGNFSSYYKQLIAEIILNRYLSDNFPNTIAEIILAEGQFTEGDYGNFVPSQETKAIVRSVFTKMNPSHSATFYYNPALSVQSAIHWFEYSGDLEYLFSYEETIGYITYTTKFFKEADFS